MASSKKKSGSRGNEPKQTVSTEPESQTPTDEQTQETPDEGQPEDAQSDTEADDDTPDTEEGGQEGAEAPQDAENAGDGAEGGEGVESPAEQPADRREASGAEPDGVIIRYGEDVRIEADTVDNIAIIRKPHYIERRLRGSKRVSYRLLYPAGTTLPLSALKKA